METQNNHTTNAQTAEDPKGRVVPPQNLPVMEIKTMEKDLDLAENPNTEKKSSLRPPSISERLTPLAPAPPRPVPPVPPRSSAPTATPFGGLPRKEPAPKIISQEPVLKKEEKKELSQPTNAQKEKQELETFFQEGFSLFQKNFYPEAIEQLTKVVDNQKAPFFLKLKAKRIIDRANKKLAAQKEPLEKISEKPILISPEKPEPLATLHPTAIPPLATPSPEFSEESRPQKKVAADVPADRRATLDWPRVIFVFSLLVLAIAIVATVIFYFQGKDVETPAPLPETPSITPAAPPTRLIFGQFEETLDYSNEDNLRQALETTMAREIKEGYLKNILVKKVVDLKESYLSLDELLANFDSSIPQNVKDNLADSYNLLIYQQKQGDQTSPFQEQDFTANKRLVLVVAIKDKEKLQQALTAWEKTIAKDLPLLFFKKNAGQPQTETFQENFYRGTLIKYQNFSDPGLSLDYVIIDGLLLLATSRESAFASLDRILENL